MLLDPSKNLARKLFERCSDTDLFFQENYALYKNSDPADIPITTFVKSAQSEITCASAGDLTVAIHQTIPVALTVNDSAYPELGTARTISESESHGDEVYYSKVDLLTAIIKNLSLQTTNVTATELSQSPPSFAQVFSFCYPTSSFGC